MGPALVRAEDVGQLELSVAVLVHHIEGHVNEAGAALVELPANGEEKFVVADGAAAVLVKELKQLPQLYVCVCVCVCVCACVVEKRRDGEAKRVEAERVERRRGGEAVWMIELPTDLYIKDPI